jgi:predicted transcriptional regulator
MKPKVKNWIKQLENGNIKTNTTKILYAICKHTYRGKGYTNVNQLRTELNLPHQTLTAILSMVQDEGMIDMFGEIEINKNKYQKIRYAKPGEREALVYNRRIEKFNQWLKRGTEGEYKDLFIKFLKSIQS